MKINTVKIFLFLFVLAIISPVLHISAVSSYSSFVESMETDDENQENMPGNSTDINVNIYHDILNIDILKNVYVEWDENITLADVLDILVLDGYLTGRDYDNRCIKGIEKENFTYLNGDYGGEWVFRINGITVPFSINSIVMSKGDVLEINFSNAENTASDFPLGHESVTSDYSSSSPLIKGTESKEISVAFSVEELNNSDSFPEVSNGGFFSLLSVIVLIIILVLITMLLLIRKNKSFSLIFNSVDVENEQSDEEDDDSDF